MSKTDKLHDASRGAHEARAAMGPKVFYQYLRRELRMGEALAERLAYTTPIPVREAPSSALNAFAGLVGISRRTRS